MAQRELRKLIKDMGKIPPDTKKSLRREMRAIAKPVLAEVRKRAGFSRRIPRAARIGVNVGGKFPGASIVVSAKRAPHARPIENEGLRGTFRHPVFGGGRGRRRHMVFGHERPGAFDGTNIWVAQPARPYFYGSVNAKADETAERVGDLVTRVSRTNGFH